MKSMKCIQRVGNVEIMIYDKVREVIEEFFESLLNRYQTELEISMRGRDFIFHCVEMLHYKCHKINLKRSGSYIDSPNWIKNKKARINVINDDDKCFQYVATVALNNKEIGRNWQRISKIKLLINKYNWKVINYSLGKDYWKNERKIMLLLLLMCYMVKSESTPCLLLKTELES